MTDLDPLLASARAVPDLAVGVLHARYERPLAAVETPSAAAAALALDGAAPVSRDDAVRAAVRDLLRRDGYKPTGRGKPASEYLVQAAEAGRLGPINAAVDACNAASLHSGLPISVVDLDRSAPPLRVQVGGPDEAYVFNASGQEIRLGGLLCLADAAGPCANPVRDSQRTKTHDGTQRTLSVVWAPEALRDRLATTLGWYAALVAESGAAVETALS